MEAVVEVDVGTAEDTEVEDMVMAVVVDVDSEEDVVEEDVLSLSPVTVPR